MGPIINLKYLAHRKLRVLLRGGKPLVAQQLLYGAQVRSFAQHVCAKSMTQRVRMDVRWQSFGNGDLLHDPSNAPSRQRPAALVDEQSLRRLPCLPQQLLSDFTVGM